MLVSFVVVQFAPGGPVKRVIAQLSGSDTVSGSPGGDLGRREAHRCGELQIWWDRGSTPNSSWKLTRLQQPAYERFFLMLWNYAPARAIFATPPFCNSSRRNCRSPFRSVYWLTLLTYLISGSHSASAKAIKDGSRDSTSGRQGHHHRPCHPGISVCNSAHHSVRRRLVLQSLSVARPDVRQLGASCRSPEKYSIISGIWCCRSHPWGLLHSPP